MSCSVYMKMASKRASTALFQTVWKSPVVPTFALNHLRASITRVRCMSSEDTSTNMSPLFKAAIEEAKTRTAQSKSPSTSTASSTSADTADSASVDIHAIFQSRTEAANRLPFFTTGNMRASPQKMNHLARLIRKMPITEAKRQMAFTLKRRGISVVRLLHRIECALRHNYNLNPDDFIIHQALVGKGTYLKRIRIHARGRFGVMHRPHAHIKIKLGPRMPEGTAKDKELRIIANILRRKKLYISLEDSKPIQRLHPPWSRKPWKYVTSPRWTNPDRILIKKQ
ncbi:hypothetical protein BDV3_006701 [Batrachochytrium dendrobatidis]|nr:39S ribosomal protein L22, mitochondrial [Batrachochytrium dendrobatidis]KAK5665646.1 39S ribosomal protein L22, mitochondrial [Batrachochytrium dendrobatidis]